MEFLDVLDRLHRLHRRWRSPGTPGTLFGNIAVLVFLCVQCLDGVFTYLGIITWGVGIEGNPLISSAVAHAGPGAGLAAAKLLASAFGIALHLWQVHGIVALLSAFYVAAAIIPWAALLLQN